MTNAPVIAIRRRRDDDLQELAKILVEVHARDGYPVEGVGNPTEWLSPPGLIASWVATTDRVVVAQVALSDPDPDDLAPTLCRKAGITTPLAVLGRMFVSPNARGLRLGAALTRTASDHAFAIGRRAVLDVMDKDAAAIRTYEALGWQALGRATHRFGEGRTEPATAYVAPATEAQSEADRELRKQ